MKPTQESQSANMAAGKTSSGSNGGKHNCETTVVPPSKNIVVASKKKLEEIERQKRERAEELVIENIAKEKREAAMAEIFKKQNCIKLDYIHAFGVYTGPSFQDISGQI